MKNNKIIPTPKKNLKISSVSTAKKKVIKVEEGLEFTPTGDDWENVWYEVDYLIGGKGTDWDCKFEGKEGMNDVFSESDILRWVNNG